MFRSIFTKTRTAIDAAVLRSGYCTTPQIRRIQPGNHHITPFEVRISSSQNSSFLPHRDQ